MPQNSRKFSSFRLYGMYVTCAAVYTVNGWIIAGVKAMCRVWHEVTLELRYRWENGILLPK